MTLLRFRTIPYSEVILAAGVFNTAQILKLSSIGPAAELAKWNIPFNKDLPAASPTSLAQIKDCAFNKPGSSDPCLHRWEADVRDRGPYGTNGFLAGVITRSNVAVDSNNDLFILGGLANLRGYYVGYAEDVVRDAKHWTWVVLKTRTSNHAGTATLKSKDHRDAPDINFRYFDTGTTAAGVDKRDAGAIVDGTGVARRTFIEPPGVSAIYGGAAGPKPQHHVSCACKTGADNDLDVVLDSSFRREGSRYDMQGLRFVSLDNWHME
ncbi:hypothetical protein V1527DRAFT_485135 [Lipomyces starkeyi]